MKIHNLRRNLFFAFAAFSVSIPIWASNPSADIVADRSEIKNAIHAVTADEEGRSLIFQTRDMAILDEMTEEVYTLLQKQAEQSGYSNLALHYASFLLTVGSLLAALISHEPTNKANRI